MTRPPRRAFAALLLAATASLAVGADTVDLDTSDTQRWLGEHYYGVFRGESRVGWVRRALELDTFEKQRVVVRTVESFVDLAGDGNGVWSTERVVYLVEGAQLMVQIERSGVQQGVETSRIATRRGERFDVLTVRDGKEVDGAVHAVDVSLADELVLERLILSASRMESGAVGAEATSGGLDLRTMQRRQRTLRVVATEELTEERGGYAVSIKTPDGRLSEPLIVDEYGVLVRGAMRAGLRLDRMPKAEALASAGRVSVEVSSRLPMEGRLGDLGTLQELVVSMPAPVGDGRAPFGATGRQSVAIVDGRLVLTIRASVDAGEVTEAERQVALAASEGVDPSEPTVRAAANRALEGTSRRAVQVERLLRFVARRISDAVVLDEPSATEILEQPRGDCSEHARLFVALARAAGIPAREVTGVVWLGDDQQAFGWHAWAEVELLGRWRPVDPTAGVSPAHAAHLRVDPRARADGALDDVRLRLEKSVR